MRRAVATRLTPEAALGSATTARFHLPSIERIVIFKEQLTPLWSVLPTLVTSAD